MSDETYQLLMTVIKESELEELIKHTGYDEDELLKDYVLYTALSEIEISKLSWNEYYFDTLHFI
jgi:hypothetical protein